MTNLKNEIAQQALTNATAQSSGYNYDAIYQGFFEKGIALEDILPRENVFTYNAWRALNRQVRKGEKGVKVVVFLKSEKTDKESGEKKESRFQRTTTVFHISQTDPVQGSDEPADEAQAVAAPVAPTPVAKNEDAANAAYELGDVFYSSWGYEQTNVNFYQLISKKGKSTLVFRELNTLTSFDGSMDGTKKPILNDFKSEKEHVCRINKNGWIKIGGSQALSPAPYSEINGNLAYKALSFSSYH